MQAELPTQVLDDLIGAKLTKAIAEAGKWVDGTERALVLEGGTGSGKTLGAGWAASYVRARGGVVLWCWAPSVSAVAEWRHREWAPFDRADLVVVDDVGDERDHEGAALMLARAWNMARGRLLFTTNNPLDTWAKRYGARVHSRMQACRWITLADPDFRVKPPTGRAAPDPAAKTKREHAEEKAREEARAAEEEAELAELRQRQLWAENAVAELAEKTGVTRQQSEAEAVARDEIERRKITAQLEHLRKLQETEAANG